MSSGNDREHRAFEALIVSQLRRDCHPDKGIPDDPPNLNEAETEALNAIDSNLVDRLWNQKEEVVAPVTLPQGGMTFSTPMGAMNRADEIDETTTQELNQQRDRTMSAFENERIKKGKSA
jgi:hypothetical protein